MVELLDVAHAVFYETGYDEAELTPDEPTINQAAPEPATIMGNRTLAEQEAQLADFIGIMGQSGLRPEIDGEQIPVVHAQNVTQAVPREPAQ